MADRHRISTRREIFKFSCAHMTVFPDGTKERLHGHNYYVGVALDLASIAFSDMIAFEPLKRATQELCQSLRERVLLARDNPFFEVVRDEPGEFEFRLCGQRYVLPREDVVVLPIDNVAVETLAAYVASSLVDRLGEISEHPAVVGLEVVVEESPGQGGVCYRAL